VCFLRDLGVLDKLGRQMHGVAVERLAGQSDRPAIAQYEPLP
jgi:hypothetical protein